MGSVRTLSLHTFSRIATAHIEGTARSIRHRQQQFHRLHGSLVKSKTLLTNALRDDYGYSELEALFEFCLTLSELRSTFESLNLEAENAATRIIERGNDTTRRVVGAGIVYIRPENSRTSVYSILSPLCTAMAAGNCVVVEMPKTTKRLTSILRKLLLETLSHDSFAVSEELPHLDFLRLCVLVQQEHPASELSKGNNGVEKLICPSWSRQSLGFVDRTANLGLAARSALEARFAFQAKSSYALDTVFVHEAVLEEFIEQLLPLVERFSAFDKLAVLHPSGKRPQWSEKPSAVADKSLSFDIVLSGSRGIIVLVRDTPRTAFKLPVLVLQRAIGMDDMIDTAGKCGEDASTVPAGAFIFAALPEANYLANAINADLTCINSFPIELLVGPKFPKPNNSLQNTSELPRYKRGMFEEVRPALVGESEVSQLLHQGITFGRAGLGTKFSKWSESLQLPLKPTDQRSGKRRDFFATAILIGATLAAIPLVGLVALVGKVAFASLVEV